MVVLMWNLRRALKQSHQKPLVSETGLSFRVSRRKPYQSTTEAYLMLTLPPHRLFPKASAAKVKPYRL